MICRPSGPSPTFGYNSVPSNHFLSVRLLSIRVIAEKWYSESIRVPQATIEKELQRSLLNMAAGRDWREDGLLDLSELTDLPSLDQEISKEHVREFCSKQDWPLPRFWFPDEAPPVRQRGRPSHKNAIVQEFERRAGAGELEVNVTTEARALAEWSVLQGNTRNQYQTIQN